MGLYRMSSVMVELFFMVELFLLYWLGKDNYARTGIGHQVATPLV